MRFVSPALKHIVFPALSKAGYFRYTAGVGPAVVTYHGVFPAGYRVRNAGLDGNLVQSDSLRLQLGLLRTRYDVISPENFFGWIEGKISLPPRSVLLTCDDALRNTLTEMVPILRDFGMSCFFFATGASADDTPSMLWYEELYLMLLEASDSLTLSLPAAGVIVGPITPGEKHACWWKLVEALSQFGRELRRTFLDQIRDQLGLSENWGAQFVQDPTLAARFLMLDRAGLQQLVAAGMTVGAHSLSHPILARASEGLACKEISESRTVLQDVLGHAVWAFGYPFGNAGTVTVRDQLLAEQAGFRCAFMNAGGGFGAKLDRFAMPRVHVSDGMSLSEFEAHISGFYRSLRSKMPGGDD